jgi:hypothetical protein
MVTHYFSARHLRVTYGVDMIDCRDLNVRFIVNIFDVRSITC